MKSTPCKCNIAALAPKLGGQKLRTAFDIPLKCIPSEINLIQNQFLFLLTEAPNVALAKRRNWFCLLQYFVPHADYLGVFRSENNEQHQKTPLLRGPGKCARSFRGKIFLSRYFPDPWKESGLYSVTCGRMKKHQTGGNNMDQTYLTDVEKLPHMRWRLLSSHPDFRQLYHFLVDKFYAGISKPRWLLPLGGISSSSWEMRSWQSAMMPFFGFLAKNTRENSQF